MYYIIIYIIILFFKVIQFLIKYKKITSKESKLKVPSVLSIPASHSMWITSIFQLMYPVAVVMASVWVTVTKCAAFCLYLLDVCQFPVYNFMFFHSFMQTWDVWKMLFTSHCSTWSRGPFILGQSDVFTYDPGLHDNVFITLS